MNFAVQTKDLRKNYGKNEVLKGLNMNVPINTTYGFIGINGAGKTTTFGILGGFTKEDYGFFEITGKMSMLPQDAKFYPLRSILSQLKFFALLSGVESEKAEEAAMITLEIVDLIKERNLKPGKLSHGMTKRLAIAQALLGNPDILILDEPIAGLDPKNAHGIKKLIKGLSKIKTIIISSHNLSEISELCDNIGIIKDGEMQFEGSISEVTKKGSSITYRLSSGLFLMTLDGVKEIKDKFFNAEESTLTIIFDEKEISPDQMNAKVIKILTENNVGVHEITLGESLEESFLKMIE